MQGGTVNSETDTLRPLSFHSANYALWKEAPSRGSSVKLWADGDKEDLHKQNASTADHTGPHGSNPKGIPTKTTLRPLSFHCARKCALEGGPFGGDFAVVCARRRQPASRQALQSIASAPSVRGRRQNKKKQTEK